jgi:hypothetical protein
LSLPLFENLLESPTFNNNKLKSSFYNKSSWNQNHPKQECFGKKCKRAYKTCILIDSLYHFEIIDKSRLTSTTSIFGTSYKGNNKISEGMVDFAL